VRALKRAPRETAPPADRRKLVVLVGEDPGPSGDPAYALHDAPDGCAGHRLRLLTGLSSADYLSTFARVNLRQRCDSKWSAPAAREAALALLPALDGRVVVLLGAKVRDAFRSPPDKYAFSDHPGPSERRVLLAGMPHPSGLCRDWRDPDKVAEARAFFALTLAWLRDDPAPHDVLQGLRRDVVVADRGCLAASSLVELHAEVLSSGAELRGPPRRTADGMLVRVAIACAPEAPCEGNGCGRPWPESPGKRGRHLCPLCSAAGRGHGL
jgi:hypothetical protein